MWRSHTVVKEGVILVDRSCSPSPTVSMDVLANHSIFQELQLVHDTGYFSAMPSLEENWQQVCLNFQSQPLHPLRCGACTAHRAR